MRIFAGFLKERAREILLYAVTLGLLKLVFFLYNLPSDALNYGFLLVLVTLRTTVAFCDERIEVFVARNLTPSKQHLDEDEFIELKAYTMEELKQKIFSKEIEDSKTVAALMAYAVKYGC